MKYRSHFIFLLLLLVFFIIGIVTAEFESNWYEKGKALEKEGKYAEALKIYDKNPDFPLALVQKGKILDILGRYDEAIAAYNKALHNGGSDPWAYKYKVTDLLKLGLQNDAQNSIKTAKEAGIIIDISPNGSVEVQGLHDNYYQSPIAAQQTNGLNLTPSVPTSVPVVISSPPPGNVTPVNSSANKPVSLINSESFSHTPRLSFIVGITPEDKKKLEDTLKTLEAQVTEDPKNLEAWAEKGNILRLLGRFSEAVAEYDKLLKENPDYAPALTGKGTAITEANNPELNGNLSGYTSADAIMAYEKSLEINPDNHITLTGLGYAYRFALEADTEEDIEKNRQASLQAFSKALQIQSDFPEALIGKSLVIEDLSESIKDLELVRTQSPKIGETYALLYLVTRDPSYIQNLIEIEPNQSYPFIFQGENFLDSGKPNESVDSFNKAYLNYLLLDKFPGEYCELWSNLVRSYSDSGDESKSNEFSLKLPDMCKGGAQ